MKAFFVGRHRRNGELVLIVLGGLVTTGAYVLASVGRLSSIPANVVPFLIIVLGLFVAAHVATRFLAPEADGLLLPLAGLLNGLGYVFIARLNDDLAAHQAVWTFLGVGLYVATLLVVRRSRDLEGYRYTLLLIGLGPARAPDGAIDRPDDQRLPHLGSHRADQLPARRIRQACVGHLLRELHRRQA